MTNWPIALMQLAAIVGAAFLLGNSWQSYLGVFLALWAISPVIK